MTAIFKREVKSYFSCVVGWLYLAVSLALYGLYYFVYNLNYGYTRVSYALDAISFILLIIVPVLTMRSLSEERQKKTDQLMFTSPVSITKIVMGKYLAMAFVHTMVCFLMMEAVCALMMFGNIPILENLVAILGFWLYGLLCIAIGLFVSSRTESQVIAAVLTFAFLFVGYMMQGITQIISASGNLLTKILGYYDILSPLAEFFGGVLPVTGIVYYVTVILFFLALTGLFIKKRRFTLQKKKIRTETFYTGITIVMIAVTILVQFGAEQIPDAYAKIDITSQKIFALTDETKAYLDTLEKDVEIYVLALEKDMDATVKGTLNRLNDVSKHVKVSYVDTSVNTDFAKKYTEEEVAAGSLIVVSGKMSRVVSLSELYEYTMDSETYSQQITGYDGEGEIVSAMQYVTSEKLPVFYELTGHGETAIAGNFKSVLEKANITLQSLNLLEVDAMPEDADGLFIVGAVSDFSEDDAAKVSKYLENGGKVFVALNPQMNNDMPNFASVLKNYDVALIDGVVAENDRANYYQSPFYILPEVISSSYTYSVGNDYVFMPNAKAIQIPAESTEEVTYQTIFSSSENAVSKTDTTNATTYEYEDGDIKGPFTLAAAVKKGTEEKESHLVVFGSAEFFTDQADSMVSGNNSKMFADVIASFEVSGDKTGGVVIPVKNYSMERLTVAAATAIILGISVLAVVPILLIATGVLIWMRRRKA